MQSLVSSIAGEFHTRNSKYGKRNFVNPLNPVDAETFLTSGPPAPNEEWGKIWENDVLYYGEDDVLVKWCISESLGYRHWTLYSLKKFLYRSIISSMSCFSNLSDWRIKRTQALYSIFCNSIWIWDFFFVIQCWRKTIISIFINCAVISIFLLAKISTSWISIWTGNVVLNLEILLIVLKLDIHSVKHLV